MAGDLEVEVAIDQPLDIGGAIHDALQKPLEEDGPGIDVTASEPRFRSNSSDLEKTPLEESKALIAVRDACHEVLAGSLEADGMVAVVSPVRQYMLSMQALFELPQVERELDRCDDVQRELADSTYDSLCRLVEGLDRILQYAESGEETDLREGLAEFESAFAELDRHQDQALEIVEEHEDGEEE